MQLEHSFRVPVGVDEAWSTLTDVERVVPCMPGATLERVEGDELAGTVKVKVGPISLTYSGTGRWLERDADAHRAQMRAQGKDARGNGTAAATVTMSLHPGADPSTTDVRVETDLDITGRPAQFGRGVMVDVGNKLIGRFADCLAGQLTVVAPDPEVEPADTTAPAAGPDAATEAGPVAATAAAPVEPEVRPADERRVEPAGTAKHVPPWPAAEPVDLVGAAGPALVRRLVPVAAAAVVVLVVVLCRRARRTRDDPACAG
ncbi:hypothetical protein GCM10009809_41720 [Isoptericola hypogeus]|uniref:Carbon monoxide dehydrogenase subunit G n=1 Tax=Isoptericola hypogeus TaxID=300179 RepID=A0ABN2JXQ9_9MICO